MGSTSSMIKFAWESKVDRKVRDIIIKVPRTLWAIYIYLVLATITL